MEIVFYSPCQPGWLCQPALLVISTLLLIGMILFLRILYREYCHIRRTQKVLRHRQIHYRIRREIPRPYSARMVRRKKKRFKS